MRLAEQHAATVAAAVREADDAKEAFLAASDETLIAASDRYRLAEGELHRLGLGRPGWEGSHGD